MARRGSASALAKVKFYKGPLLFLGVWPHGHVSLKLMARGVRRNAWRLQDLCLERLHCHFHHVSRLRLASVGVGTRKKREAQMRGSEGGGGKDWKSHGQPGILRLHPPHGRAARWLWGWRERVAPVYPPRVSVSLLQGATGPCLVLSSGASRSLLQPRAAWLPVLRAVTFSLGLG